MPGVYRLFFVRHERSLGHRDIGRAFGGRRAAPKARKAETAESNAQLVRAMIARGDSEGIRRMMAPMVIATANIIVAPDKAFTAKGPALAALSQLCADAVAAASGPCSVATLLS